MLDAFDVWGYVTPGVEVCFAQLGSLVFLDAAYSPRQLVDLPEYSRDGMTCAEIDRPGTLVLLQSDQPPPPLASTAVPSQALSDCHVKAWAILNFRVSPPDGAVLHWLLPDHPFLRASEKRDGYFKVHYNGRDGWISGDYVFTRGNCG